MRRAAAWLRVAAAGAALAFVSVPLADTEEVPEPVRGLMHVHTARAGGRTTTTLFVIDQTHTPPGRRGRVWIDG